MLHSSDEYNVAGWCLSANLEEEKQHFLLQSLIIVVGASCRSRVAVHYEPQTRQNEAEEAIK